MVIRRCLRALYLAFFVCIALSILLSIIQEPNNNPWVNIHCQFSPADC